MKLLNITFLSLLAFPAMAHEITSPFYLPEMAHVLNETGASYTKNKFKQDSTTRFYQRALDEKITLGLGVGLAALLTGDLNWTKQKQDQTLSVPHTKSYGAGLKGQWELGGLLTQISALYHQTTNVRFSPRREMEADLRFGKELKTMTPYLHLNGRFPLNARTEFNAPLYRAETGVFQSVNDKMTLDTALYLGYNKNIHGKSYGVRTELSYLICSWSSISINGEWQARGNGKHSANTYHQSVGANIRFAF